MVHEKGAGISEMEELLFVEEDGVWKAGHGERVANHPNDADNEGVDDEDDSAEILGQTSLVAQLRTGQAGGAGVPEKDNVETLNIFQGLIFMLRTAQMKMQLIPN